MNDEQELTAEAEATEEVTEPAAKEEKPKAAPRQNTRQRIMSSNDPLSYKGGRQVLRTTTCGWCMDGIHGDKCKHETPHFEKLWVCKCECNKDWVPQDLGSGEIIEESKPVIAETSDETSDEVKEPVQPEKPSAPPRVRRKVGR